MEKFLAHCRICEIRVCSIDKKLENCVFCNDYDCKTLGKIYSSSKETKVNPEGLRLEHENKNITDFPPWVGESVILQ